MGVQITQGSLNTFYYTVSAVDDQNLESVKSEHVSTHGVFCDQGGGLDKSMADRSADDLSKPEEFSLNQNYPNPFNPETQIDYSIKEAGHASLMVYDITGRKVAELVNEYRPEGFYSVSFNGKDLPSGMYIYTLIAGNYRESKKMMILK